MSSKSVKLSKLKIQSFVTSMESGKAKTAKGGATIGYVLTNRGCGEPTIVIPSDACGEPTIGIYRPMTIAHC